MMVLRVGVNAEMLFAGCWAGPYPYVQWVDRGVGVLHVFIGAREPRIHDEAQVALGLTDSSDLSAMRLDGAEISLNDLVDACSVADMFSARRKVVLVNAQALVTGDRKTLPWLMAFADSRSDAPCDLAVLAYLDLGDTRSRPRVQALSKLEKSGAQVRLVRPLTEQDAVQFVRRRADRQGVRLDNKAAERLVEIVTPEAGLLAQEVDKLVTYVGFAGTLDLAAVDAASATIGEHPRWDYINAVSGQRPSEALGVLHDMLGLRASKQMILSDIATAMRRLATTKAVQISGGTDQDVRRKTRVPTFRLKELVSQARRTSPRLLARMYGEVVRTDRSLKSTGAHEEALLEILTARLATPPTVR